MTITSDTNDNFITVTRIANQVLVDANGGSITVDGEEIEFSGGFTDLHTLSYEGILRGEGFDLESSRTAIEAVSYIRTAPINQQDKDCHPFAARPRGG